MKKSIPYLLISILLVIKINAQNAPLPIKEWTSASKARLVLYITGDGGFNNFSTALCADINRAGYCITALDARSYFWSRKTPEQTASDIANFLETQIQSNKYQQLVLAGYSFGADVMPFIINRLSDCIKNKVAIVIMLSPSASTDFEVHWADLLGGNKKRNMDVVAEINRMGSQKTVTIFGNDENSFPVKEIKLSNYSNDILPGGHHFDGNADVLAKWMTKRINNEKTN